MAHLFIIILMGDNYATTMPLTRPNWPSFLCIQSPSKLVKCPSIRPFLLYVVRQLSSQYNGRVIINDYRELIRLSKGVLIVLAAMKHW